MIRRPHHGPLFLAAALSFAALLAACEHPATAPATLAASAARRATVPAQGTASTLDIGTWNLEWFGDAANGPTNEALQQSNVRDVLAGADVDI